MTVRLKNNLIRALSFVLIFALAFTFIFYYSNFVISNNVNAIDINWKGIHNFETLPSSSKDPNQATMTEVSNAADLSVYDNKIITISSPLELYLFSIKTNVPTDKKTDSVELAKRDKYLGFHYVLADNIVYTAADALQAVTPIAYIDKAFVGTFDGQGFEIQNMPIQIASGYDINNNLPFAMFSQVGAGGVIKNVGIVNAIINSPTQNNLNLATLAGNNGGSITSAYVVGTTIGSQHASSTFSDFFHVSPGSIDNSYFVKSIGDCHTIENSVVSTLKTAAELKTALLANPAWYDFSSIDTARPYPRLSGAKLVGGEYVLYTPSDIITLPTLIDSGLSSKTFVLNNCVDMSFINPMAYKQPATAFTGALKSGVTGTCGTVHPLASDKSNYSNHAIYNLNITGESDNTITEFGLFKGANGASVSNINFIGGEIIVPKLLSSLYSQPLNVGAVFSSAIGRVSINNVHSSMKISTLGDGTFLAKGMNVGSLAGGLVDFSITGCSYSGSIDMGYHNLSGLGSGDNVPSLESSVGGILGSATTSNTNTGSTKNDLSNCQNAGTVSGMAFRGVHVDGLTTAGDVAGNITYSTVKNNQYTGGIAGGLFGIGSVYMTDLSNVNKVSSHTSLVTNPIENRSQDIRVGGLIGKYGLTNQNVTNSFYNNANIALENASEKSRLYAGGIFADGRDALGASAGNKFNNIGNDTNGIIILNSSKAASVYMGAILGYGNIDFVSIINNAPLNVTLGANISGTVSITAGIYGGYDGTVQNAGAINVTNNSASAITELSVTALSYGLNVNGTNSAPITVENNGAVGDLNVGLSVFSNLSGSSNTAQITVTDNAAGLDVLNVAQKTLNVSGGSLKGNNTKVSNSGNISVAISGNGSSSYTAYIGGIGAGVSEKSTNMQNNYSSGEIKFSCAYVNADIVVAGIGAVKIDSKLTTEGITSYQYLYNTSTAKIIVSELGINCKNLTISGIAYETWKMADSNFLGEFIFNGNMIATEDINISGIAYQVRQFVSSVNVSDIVIDKKISSAKNINISGTLNKRDYTGGSGSYDYRLNNCANLGKIQLTLTENQNIGDIVLAGIVGDAIRTDNKGNNWFITLINKGSINLTGGSASSIVVGGIVGVLYGNPNNAINLGDINVSTSAASIIIGGVAGLNTVEQSDSLTNVINAANINAPSNAVVGGIAGSLKKHGIDGGLNWGTITGGNVVGGIVGETTGTSVIKSVINHGAIGATVSGGIVGKRTEDSGLQYAVNYGAVSTGGTIIGDNANATSNTKNVVNFFEGNTTIAGGANSISTGANSVYSRLPTDNIPQFYADMNTVFSGSKINFNIKPSRRLINNPYFFDDSAQPETTGHIFALLNADKYYNKNIEIFNVQLSSLYKGAQWNELDLDQTEAGVQNIRSFINNFNQIYLSDQAEITDRMPIVNTTTNNSYLSATYNSSTQTIDYFVHKSDITAGDKLSLSSATNFISLDATLTTNVEFIIPTGEIGTWTGWTIKRVDGKAVSALSTKKAKVTAEDGETVKEWTINLYVLDVEKSITLNTDSAKIGDKNTVGAAVAPQYITHDAQTNTYTFKFGEENSWIQPNENAFLSFTLSTLGYHKDVDFNLKDIQWRAKVTDSWQATSQSGELSLSGKTANTYSTFDPVNGIIATYANITFTVNMYQNSGWYRLNIDNKIYIEIYRKESTATDFTWWENADYANSAKGIQIQSENDYATGDISVNDIYVKPKQGDSNTFIGTVIYGDLPRFDLTKFDYGSTDFNNILFHPSTYKTGYKATAEFGGVEVLGYENSGDLKKYTIYIHVFSEFELAHNGGNSTPVVYKVELTEQNVEASATYIQGGSELEYTGQTLEVKKDGTNGSIQIKQTSSAKSYYTGMNEDGKRAEIEVVGYKYLDAVNKAPIAGIANMPIISEASSAGYKLLFINTTVNGLYLFEVAYMRDDVELTLKDGSKTTISWRQPLSSVHVDKVASKNSYIENITIKTGTSDWQTQTVGTVYIDSNGKEAIKPLDITDQTPYFGLKAPIGTETNEVLYDAKTQNEKPADINNRINLFKITFKYNLEDDYVPPLGVLFGIDESKACTIKVKQPDGTWRIYAANEYVVLNENVDTTIRVVAEDSRFFCDYIVTARGLVPDKDIKIVVDDQTGISKAFPISLKTIINAGGVFGDIEGSRYTTFIYRNTKNTYVLDTHVSAFYKLVMPSYAEYNVSADKVDYLKNNGTYYYLDLNHAGSDSIIITITLTGYNADKPWGDATSWE